MKSCKKCFEYAYVFVGGAVRFCPWNGIVIGNLKENTLEEIWHSPEAERVREAFVRGELLGCNEQYCPDCINEGTKRRLDEEDILELDEAELKQLYDDLPDLPLRLNLAYDERCNHVCPSCRHEIFCASKEYQNDLKIITKNIEPYLEKAKWIATNGIGDLFASQEIMDMLSRFHPNDPQCSIFIETNGVLFKENWNKIKHLSGYIRTVSVTPNSFDRETYKYLAGKDDLEKFEESMAFITNLKHKGFIKRIRIIMVVQDSNFRQIPQFIQKSIDYDADDIIFRSIFQWFDLQEDEYLYKNVLNPCHPYHQEYLEVIKDPICQDPRVFDWGFKTKQEAVSFPTLKMQREYKELKCKMSKLNDKFDNLNIKIKEKIKENEEFQEKASILCSEKMELQKKLISEIQIKEAMKNGYSWRLTAPLRKIRRLIVKCLDNKL